MRHWLNSLIRMDQAPYAHPQVVDGGDVDEDPTTFRVVSKEGLHFEVRAIVYFRASASVITPDPMSIAAVSIRRRAEQICSNVSLMDVDRLEMDLEVELGLLKTTDHAQVDACAKAVSVSADQREIDAVAEYERSRALALLGDWQWEQRQARATQIIELLSDPRRATAWWLASDPPNDLDSAKQVALTFVDVAEILNTGATPHNGAVDVISRLWNELDPVGRGGMLHVLGQYAAQAGKSELLEALERLER